MERRSRRTALVLTTIAVMMVCCAKLSVSGAMQRTTGVSVFGERGFRSVLEEEAPADDAAPADGDDAAVAPAPADEPADEPAAGKEGAEGRSGEEADIALPFNPATVGWDKSKWTSSDWATWIVPGPVITLVLTAFIFYMYGPMWAAGTAVVMLGVDMLAFYTNA